MRRLRLWKDRLLEVLWFDWTRWVRTAGRHGGFGNGYMPTWTRVIDEVHDWLTQHGYIEGRQLIDVGCGRGKVLLRWTELEPNATPIGIEADGTLVHDAEWNLIRRRSRGVVIQDDAAAFHYEIFGQPLTLWLFNSFGLEEIKDLERATRRSDTLIVYVNPQHLPELTGEGFNLVHGRIGYHECDTVFLLYRPKL